MVMKSDGTQLKAGILGEIHPEVAEKTECPERTCAALFEVAVLIDASSLSRKFKALPRFPAVPRDIAVVVRDEVYVADLMKAIVKAAGEILEDVSLFDVYKGSQVPEGMKSTAFALSFRSADRTLKDEEVNTAMEKILKSLEYQFDARLR
jgi:phenylalanyl-tRNA synthetase beta chain